MWETLARTPPGIYSTSDQDSNSWPIFIKTTLVLALWESWGRSRKFSVRRKSEIRGRKRRWVLWLVSYYSTARVLFCLETSGRKSSGSRYSQVGLFISLFPSDGKLLMCWVQFWAPAGHWTVSIGYFHGSCWVREFIYRSLITFVSVYQHIQTHKTILNLLNTWLFGVLSLHLFHLVLQQFGR